MQKKEFERRISELVPMPDADVNPHRPLMFSALGGLRQYNKEAATDEESHNHRPV